MVCFRHIIANALHQGDNKVGDDDDDDDNNNNNNNKGDTSYTRGDWGYFKVIYKILSNIPRKHEVKELQKRAIFGTAHTHFGKYYVKIQ